MLVGTIAAGLGGIMGGPVGAVAGAAAAPVLVASLTQRGSGRMNEMFLAAQEELIRRDQEGHSMRLDLGAENFEIAQEILEGTIVKARDSYESHKARFLGYFLVAVLYNENQNLAEAFFQLGLAERLTFQQYVLLRFFELATLSPELLDMTSQQFGHNLPKETAELMLPILDLFQLGLLTEDSGEVRPATGGLASRYGGTNISLSNPAGIRLSLAGSRLVENLCLYRVPEQLISAIELRLRA
jgi:hypothetical protein